ncbi:prepilin-type N-terminal cleavage/methylation domain-containing protein [Phragmitibacter flavus]|uniref:Prepilin-type N-terminal cleavage/methylation domain-containing protein n=1 Tax=Phragmitibacter flavus TaxID=2576071 RepID=A0A5R8KFD6_9BACT|nr:prepilin-type N-terminal cleavage/methylation domain-containing protein [Phragmitibacter flavus]TLD70695.1 prepilin-type N-terminal cleavage/methylation domain-containing protein [Phragmitibacter flavus]
MTDPNSIPESNTQTRRTQRAGPFSEKGFTLVEIMVASGVLGLLLISLAQVASTVADTWSSGHARAERRQHGRAIVDFIGKELRSAALPVHREVLSGKADLQFMLNPTQVSSELKNPHALFWQAPVATDTGHGSLAKLGYFVRWDGNKPMLCRLFINPNDSNYLIYDEEKIGSWMNAGISQSGTPTLQNGWVGLFAENVLGFWARCLDRNGQPITQTGGEGLFDSRVSYTSTVEGEATTYQAPVLPFSVEISIVMVDSRSASRFNAGVKTAIMDMASRAGTVNAATFIEALKTASAQDSKMLPVLRSAVPYQMQVYLENSP